MKKVKESGKLDINKRLTNHSARKYLLQQIRENNVEGTYNMQISGHTNVESINNYSTMSEERHKKISSIPSNTETNRNVWYQLSSTYLVQLQHPQIIQPVALLMFRVEVIQMFLPIVPIQICQAKLVLLCFTGQSSMSLSTH